VRDVSAHPAPVSVMWLWKKKKSHVIMMTRKIPRSGVCCSVSMAAENAIDVTCSKFAVNSSSWRHKQNFYKSSCWKSTIHFNVERAISDDTRGRDRWRPVRRVWWCDKVEICLTFCKWRGTFGAATRIEVSRVQCWVWPRQFKREAHFSSQKLSYTRSSF